MLQIIPAAPQKQSFGSQLGLSLGSGISQGAQQHFKNKMAKEAEEAQHQRDLQKLRLQGEQQKELQREKYGFEENILGRKQEQQQQIQNQKLESEMLDSFNKASEEKKQKLYPFISGLQTLEAMRGISDRENIGRGSSALGFFGGETARDIGEYETLGKSLISLASNIPIRNKAEFETLAGSLFDASLPKSKREGILSAMEDIIKRNMHQYLTGGEESFFSQPDESVYKSGQPTKQRKPLTAFE